MQQRVRRHGDTGILGNRGIVESASCRFNEVVSGSNPTLSAIINSITYRNPPCQRAVAGNASWHARCPKAEHAWRCICIGATASNATPVGRRTRARANSTNARKAGSDALELPHVHRDDAGRGRLNANRSRRRVWSGDARDDGPSLGDGRSICVGYQPIAFDSMRGAPAPGDTVTRQPWLALSGMLPSSWGRRIVGI